MYFRHWWGSVNQSTFLKGQYVGAPGTSLRNGDKWEFDQLHNVQFVWFWFVLVFFKKKNKSWCHWQQKYKWRILEVTHIFGQESYYELLQSVHICDVCCLPSCSSQLQSTALVYKFIKPFPGDIGVKQWKVIALMSVDDLFRRKTFPKWWIRTKEFLMSAVLVWVSNYDSSPKYITRS